MREIFVGSILLFALIAATPQAVAFFDDGMNQAELQAEAKRLASLREEMGDETFARHVVERFQRILPMVPRSHPLHEQYSKTPGRPEHEYATHMYFYAAALSELAKTGHQPALPTLKQIIQLSQMRVTGEPWVPYFHRCIARDATKAYFAIGAADKPATRRLEVLADAFEWLAEPQWIVDAVEQYGQGIAPQLLAGVLEHELSHWSPAAVANLGRAIGRDPALGFDDAALLDLCASPRKDVAGSGMVAVASRRSISADQRLEVVTRHLRLAIAELRRKPRVTERPEDKQTAAGRWFYYCERAIKADLRPVYRPLLMEAVLLVPCHVSQHLLAKLGPTAADTKALLAAAISPERPEREKAALLRCLVHLKVTAARQPVLQFIQRNSLKAIGHEDETRRENYPELGLHSLDVQNWMQWAKDETGR